MLLVSATTDMWDEAKFASEAITFDLCYSSVSESMCLVVIQANHQPMSLF